MRSASSASARSQTARSGHVAAREALERLAIRPRERDGRVAGYARGEPVAFVELRAPEQPLDALVHVAQTLLELQHLLADDREAEMAGLDDARMHGPDRDLVHTVARHAHERIVIRRRRAVARVVDRARRERLVLARPRRVPQPRPHVRVERRDAGEVRGRALHPRRRRKIVREPGVRHLAVVQLEIDDERGAVAEECGVHGGGRSLGPERQQPRAGRRDIAARAAATLRASPRRAARPGAPGSSVDLASNARSIRFLPRDQPRREPEPLGERRRDEHAEHQHEYRDARTPAAARASAAAASRSSRRTPSAAHGRRSRRTRRPARATGSASPTADRASRS